MSGPPAAPDGTLVDIGIPTYGRPRYLAEAIECVLEQTLPSWRLTISENGPGSNHVAEVVEPHLADARIRYVTTGENLGGARNSTRLIQAGSAPYVALLHDDDRWDPEFLARRAAFLEAHPTCGLVLSSYDFIDSNGAVVHRFEVDLAEGVQDRTAFLRTLYRLNVIGIPTPLVRRTAYETVRPVFNETILFYDHEMWLRIASRFDIGFLPISDAQWRVHSSQTTQQAQWHWGEHRLQLLDEVEKILPEHFPARERRRARWIALMRGALDGRRRGDRHAAVSSLRQAIRTYPAAPIDPAIVSHIVGWVAQRNVRRDVFRAGLSDYRDRQASDPPATARAETAPGAPVTESSGGLRPFQHGRSRT